MTHTDLSSIMRQAWTIYLRLEKMITFSRAARLAANPRRSAAPITGNPYSFVGFWQSAYGQTYWGD